MYNDTELITKYAIILYMMIGVIVSTKSLDNHTIEDHGIYSVVAISLTVVWPLLVLYILCKYIVKKIHQK